ncbi:MAG: NAD(P)H-dependent oxidoreductase [Undibacterium sp.]|nr:NAD(P)H-dependent oxidoreductase [Opitutaceae bacterium]
MKLRVLAISGSLRRVSSNMALLQAAALVAPDGMEVVLTETVGALPHFNSDLDGAEPSVVQAWREELRAAGAILISSPEYAHGVPGALKNALDRAVSSGELSAKPVALWNASPRATLAQASLAEIVRTMDAKPCEAAGVTLPLLGKGLDAAGIVAVSAWAAELRGALGTLRKAAESAPAN